MSGEPEQISGGAQEDADGLYPLYLELRKAIRRHRKELSAETEDPITFEQALLHWASHRHAQWLRERGRGTAEESSASSS